MEALLNDSLELGRAGTEGALGVVQAPIHASTYSKYSILCDGPSCLRIWSPDIRWPGASLKSSYDQILLMPVAQTRVEEH